jgi:hypothetical protein
MLVPLYDKEQEQKLDLQQDQSAAKLREQRQQFFPFQILLDKSHPFQGWLEECTHVVLVMNQRKRRPREPVVSKTNLSEPLNLI